MATPVIMPRQGQSVESCIIGEWHRNVGDRVEVDDLLFTYETDKAAFDEKARVAGTLLAVFYQEGEDVPCLNHVAVIGEPGEPVDAYDPRSESRQAADPDAGTDETIRASSPDPASDSLTQSVHTDTTVSPARTLPASSPRARRLAAQKGVDWQQASGSGPGGRIIEDDIVRFESRENRPEETGVKQDIVSARSPEPAGEAVRKVPHSRVRQLIARSMHDSLSQMAQLTLNSSFDATELFRLRRQLKTALTDQHPLSLNWPQTRWIPTVNDLILWAVSRVLPLHPVCNAWYDETQLTLVHRVHLGVAIDTPRGLMVPTLRSADRMSLEEMTEQTRRLAADCQAGTVNPDLLQGGTFTVTNLGTLGVEHFTPVINPPQTCILGVGCSVERVRHENGAINSYPAIGLSLTFDHRALDGAPAARFLKDLVWALEHLPLMLWQHPADNREDGGSEHV